MAAEKFNITICQGSVFRLPFLYRDGDGFGVDLTNAEIRMQIRTPDRDADPPVLSLVSGASTGDGSTITLISESVIAPTAITDFGADGNVEATGAGFEETVTKVSAFDPDTGDPTQLVDEIEKVAKIADLARIAGSTSNDGDFRVSSVVDEDNVVLNPEPTVEAAAGTIEILRRGRFEILITAAESDAFDFDRGEYDIEIVEDTTTPTEPIRLVQGRVRLDKQATR